jgi:hypothetical protein
MRSFTPAWFAAPGLFSKQGALMPAYNFKPQFAEAVEQGRKRTTIRAWGPLRGAQRGMTAYLYTGMRTKQCRKLGTGLIVSVRSIKISRARANGFVVEVDGSLLNRQEIDKLALDDGFANVLELIKFFNFNYAFPFEGFIHQWELDHAS